MTLEEMLEKFEKGTTVLHAPTQEIYDKLMAELEKRGYRWVTGKKPTFPHCWDTIRNRCIVSNIDGLRHGAIEYYRDKQLDILELTAEELEKDIATLESLYKKYNTAITGNLENTMREKLKELQRVPMEIIRGDYVINFTDVEVTKDDSGYHVISKGNISGHVHL